MQGESTKLDHLKFSEDNFSCDRFGAHNSDFEWSNSRFDAEFSATSLSPKNSIWTSSKCSSTTKGKVAEFDEEEMSRPQRKDKKKQTRWKKEDDHKLYASFMQILKENTIDAEELESWERIVSVDIINTLGCVNSITGWKGSSASMIQRILKLRKNPRSLSSREMKELRKTYYKWIKEDSLDWEQLLYKFPGKDPEFIKETCKNFPRGDKLLKQTSTHYPSQ